MKILSYALLKQFNLSILLALFISAIFLSGCSSSQDENSYVQFSNPAVKFKQNISPRSSDVNTVDSFIISISGIDGNEIKSIDTFKLSDTVKLTVPANVALIITGKAYLDETLLYSGEVTIDAIPPGFGSKLTLLLQDLSQANEKVQIDTIPTSTQSSPTKPSLGVSFSRDNDYVLFISDEDNLVSNDTNQNADVFIRNLSTDEVTLLHADSNGVIGDVSGDRVTVDEADISADGLFAVFASYSESLVPSNANGSKNVFLKNTSNGNITQLSIHESIDSTNLDSYNPQISDDGNTITFYSKARIINSASDTLFVVTRYPPQIEPLSIGDVSDKYKLSGDGKTLVYQSKTDNSLKIVNIFEETDQSLIGALSLNSAKTISDVGIDIDFSINQDGQFVLFIPRESTDNLVKDQYYLYDNLTHKTKLVSKTRTNTLFKGVLAENTVPAISKDGRYVAFAYDGITFVRNIAFDNLVEVGPGVHPFLSNKGDKLGFEYENNLFFVSNPLYIDATSPTQKAQAPSNFNLLDTDGKITLSWDSIPNASYYRIYQSNQPDVALKLGDKTFKPEFYETTETTYSSFFPSSYNYRNFYLVVFAVDENGEGIASAQVTYSDTNIRSGEGSLLDPMPIVLPYSFGSTNGDKSYYKFTILNSTNDNQTYAVKVLQTGLIEESAELVLTDNNPNTTIDCGAIFNVCNITGVNRATEFVLIVDGENNDDIFYTISVSEIPNTLNVSTSIDRNINNKASTTKPITVYFSEAIVPETIASSITLIDAEFQNVPTTITFDTTQPVLSASIQPDNALFENNSYTLIVNTTLTAESDITLTQNYVVSFTANQFINEGSLSNPVEIDLPYLGVVNGNTSYYRISLPQSTTSQSYAIQIKSDSGLVSFPLLLRNLSTDNLLDCLTVTNTCLVTGLNEATDFILAVNSDALDITATFNIKVANILSVDAKMASSTNFDFIGATGVVSIKSLEPDTEYHISDLTYSSVGIIYVILNPLIPLLECYIIINIEPGVFQDDCVISSNANGEIFFEIAASPNYPITNITRNFQLDIIHTLAFNADPQLSQIEITDEKIVKFINLDPMKEYYVALTSLEGGATYQVSPNLFFSNISLQAHCEGQLHAIDNDLDSCAFQPLADGKIVIHLDDSFNTFADATSINLQVIELVALSTPIESFLDLPIDKRLKFIKLSSDFRDSSWYSLEVQFQLRFSGTMTTYDNLQAMPICKTELIQDITACEFVNNNSHLIAFEFSKESVLQETSAGIFSSEIQATPINPEITLGYLDYYYVTPLTINAPYYVIKKTTLTNTSISPELQVFNDYWRKPICTTVIVRNSQLCITNTPGFQDRLNIKLTDYPLIYIEGSYDADIVLEGRPTNELIVGTVENYTSTGEYEVFFIQNIDVDTKITVRISSVIDPDGDIPFTVVSSNSDYSICQSQADPLDFLAHICTLPKESGSAFIIIDTTAFPNLIEFDISVYDGVLPPRMP